LKGPSRIRIMSLVEHEGLDTEQTEFSRNGTEIVDRLLHGIANVDKHLRQGLACLAPDVAEHPRDLGLATPAVNLGHKVSERLRVGDPLWDARHSPNPRK
jgi:phage tail protein X